MKSDTYENLHPELEKYLEPMEYFGRMLRHPLLYAVPYFGEAENDRLNKLFEYRKDMLQKYQATGDHSGWVFTHERPYRFQALRELCGEIPDKDFRDLVLEVYVDTESARDEFEEWEQILEKLTGLDPWNTLHELQDTPITVYRGGVKKGFSWTTDINVAKWFSKRYNGNGTVWVATVTKDDIIGYYDGRNEKEVIAAYQAVEHLIEPYKD